jgi:hypothetical protein
LLQSIEILPGRSYCGRLGHREIDGWMRKMLTAWAHLSVREREGEGVPVRDLVMVVRGRFLVWAKRDAPALFYPFFIYIFIFYFFYFFGNFYILASNKLKLVSKFF